MASATLYTLSAPSGAGKTSLVKALTQQDKTISVSISHTTRQPRPGERDGLNYHFIDTHMFENMIAKHQFLEHAKVFNNYYGTSAEWVKQQLTKNLDVLLEIDYQGAAQIKKLMPETVAVFILPPSLSALKQRLTGRGQDSKAIIDQRLAEAQNEIQYAHNADHIVINDNFDEALIELQTIFSQKRQGKTLQTGKHTRLLSELLT